MLLAAALCFVRRQEASYTFRQVTMNGHGPLATNGVMIHAAKTVLLRTKVPFQGLPAPHALGQAATFAPPGAHFSAASWVGQLPGAHGYGCVLGTGYGTRAGMSRVSICSILWVSTGPKSATPPMSAAGGRAGRWVQLMVDQAAALEDAGKGQRAADGSRQAGSREGVLIRRGALGPSWSLRAHPRGAPGPTSVDSWALGPRAPCGAALRCRLLAGK